MTRRLEDRLAAIERIGTAPDARQVTDLRQALAAKTGLGGGDDDALAAARALATFRDQPGLAGRVAGASSGRDPASREPIRRLFPAPAG